MRTLSRSLAVSALVLVMLLGVMPAAPAVAVPSISLSWARNWDQVGLVGSPLDEPTDVAVDKWGNVYVAGGVTDDRLLVFDSNGNFITQRTTGADLAPLWMPVSVAVDRWGNVYAGEVGNGGRVHTFGYHLTDWNGVFPDGGPSAITDPKGLATSLDGWVYVADFVEKNVQRWRFTKDFQLDFTPNGYPTTGVAVNHDGLVYTTTGQTSGLTDRLIWYTWHGGFLGSMGGTGTLPEEFTEPHDVGVDPLGRAYVIERGGNRGQVLSLQDGYLADFGSAGSADRQFSAPLGIAVGYDRTVYVADTGNSRISKWNVSDAPNLVDVAGSNRIITAIQASQRSYPDGYPECVVIATAYNWPDALGGSALAGAADGPILLTRQDALPAEVLAEVKRLNPDCVFVLGSEASVGPAVFNALKAIEPEVKRLGGADRYETANLIAYEVKKWMGSRYDGTAFVCTGANFPDALSAAPIAAANGWPIYLTRPGHLPANVRAAMLQTAGGNPSHHGYIIGSEAAVGAAVQTELAAAPFFGFGRIGGINRYDTSAKLADLAFDGMGMLWSRPGLATGENFPDALAGGAFVGNDCSVMLLTRKGSLPSEAAALLQKNKKMVYELRIFGDTNAISTTVRNQVRGALGLPY